MERLAIATEHWMGPIACDTETHPEKLLGVSLSNGKDSLYIVINHWNKTEQKWIQPGDPDLSTLGAWLTKRKLIGHNYTYDKGWLDRTFECNTRWVADTRIMWHLASAPAGPRPYGLKDAQVEVLGWDKKGDEELKLNVESYGGKLKKGDHYLADLNVLAKYACLDALATHQLYSSLSSFFTDNDYWSFLEMMMQYNQLLTENTRQGILVDRDGLERTHKRLLSLKEGAKKRFYKELKHEITSLERDWADRRIAQYKRRHNQIRYENHPEEWEKFNLNSDAHKRELFYEKLRNPVIYTTESGKPSCNADSVKRMSGSFVEAYLKYEKSNTLSTNFTKPYLESSLDGRLHPGFNICGTVSYRLSGFKPYLLNAPFDEKAIMKNMVCDPGWVGVHADLSAIEPTITAHYSEDPALLKVFRDGLGDIYLDLALDLFKNDKELQDDYNPNVPITKAVKERFSKQRKIAKVIQLAVQYTGTGFTVSRNLSKDGIPTTVEEAEGYVRTYWKKFSKVAQFNYRLKVLNEKQGYLRNVCGRIIRVPNPEYKDLSNRFIQSSAHDVLVLWVLEIYRLCKERSIEIVPVLIDCHDSTSNRCRVGDAPQLQQIYRDALQAINNHLGLAVTIKADTKLFSSLAGLKGEE